MILQPGLPLQEKGHHLTIGPQNRVCTAVHYYNIEMERTGPEGKCALQWSR